MTAESLPPGFTWSALVPELIVSSLPASLRFWCDLIGFSVAYSRSGEGFVYLALSEVQVMLAENAGMDRWITGEMTRPFGRGVNFQANVTDIDPPLGRLKAANWPLHFEPEERWYEAADVLVGVRQFAVADPDGYLLRLSQSFGQRPKEPNEPQ